MDHDSKASFHCSNHESVAGNFMHSLNRYESWFLFSYRFRTILVLFLDFKLFWWNLRKFTGLQRLFTPCKPLNLYGFLRNLVRVSRFCTKLVRNLMNSHWFSFVVIDRYEDVSFWLLPVFYSEISNWNFKSSLNLVLFVDFWLWIRK